MSQEAYQSKEIGGVVFEVAFVTPENCLDLQETLAKSLGPAVASIFADGDTGLEENIVPALSELIKSLDSATVKRTAKMLAAVSKADAKKLVDAGNYAMLFRGKPKLLWQWLAFAVEVQLGDFFEGGESISGLLTSLLKDRKRPDQSESPSPSDGQSGD